MHKITLATAAAGILVAGAYAQSPLRPTVGIQFSTHQTCLIEGVDIPCTEVGNKLRAMRTPLNADIHLMGDPDGKAATLMQLLTSAKKSLEQAGYLVKVAYITSKSP
jgi:hypothetical protein